MATVYIFGAGATKAINPQSPLTQDLLPQMLEIQSSERNQQHLENIHGFIDDFYCYGLHNYRQGELPALEDILSQLDYAIAEDRPLGDRYTIGSLREIHESFVYGICEVLRKTLDSSSDVMNMFLAHLEENDSIISLNYELIIDNTISAKIGRALDYGVSMRRQNAPQISIIPAEHLSDQTSRAPVKLYKLHGSLNWLYCPFCQEIQLTPGEQSVHYLFEPLENDEQIRCSQCHMRYEPLIITPTLVKTYANPLLNEIWRQAEDQLMRADEIVFLGYSMPDADFYLRCMFKRAIYANLKGFKRAAQVRETCPISVVDYDPNYKPEARNEIHKRYLRVLGPIEYFAGGFEAFAKRAVQS